MARSRVRGIPFAKITAVLAVVFGVGLGCAVLGLKFAPCIAGCDKFDYGPFANVGLILVFCSAIGLLSTVVVFVLTKMIESLSLGAASETIRLFDDHKPKS